MPTHIGIMDVCNGLHGLISRMVETWPKSTSLAFATLSVSLQTFFFLLSLCLRSFRLRDIDRCKLSRSTTRRDSGGEKVKEEENPIYQVEKRFSLAPDRAACTSRRYSGHVPHLQVNDFRAPCAAPDSHSLFLSVLDQKRELESAIPGGSHLRGSRATYLEKSVIAAHPDRWRYFISELYLSA